MNASKYNRTVKRPKVNVLNNFHYAHVIPCLMCPALRWQFEQNVEVDS